MLITNHPVMKDTPKQIKNKINKYALSGGRAIVEKHRSLGGIPDIDVAYQLLKFFLEDDAKLEEVLVAYSKGEMLTGEIKKLAIETVTPIVEQHQAARKLVTEEILEKLFTIRSLKFAS